MRSCIIPKIYQSIIRGRYPRFPKISPVKRLTSNFHLSSLRGNAGSNYYYYIHFLGVNIKARYSAVRVTPNPVRIKGFAQSELIRTKTDKMEAGIIARFCLAMKPEPWIPTERAYAPLCKVEDYGKKDGPYKNLCK